MNAKKLLVFLGLLLVIPFFAPCEGGSQPLAPSEGGPTRPGTHAPIITHSFAVEKGYYGYVWKIYIEAEDPNGDMYKIASMVDEPGVGRYPTDWIILKPEYRKHFVGYIQWNTNSGYYLPEWTPITLKVTIFDKAGNESNVVVFPFTFETGVKNPY